MKKIAIALNLDWPLKRYHQLFEGVQAYADKNTDWILIWDHYPEYVLGQSSEHPNYDGIIGRISDRAFAQCKRLKVPVVNTWSSSFIEDITTVTVDYFAAGQMAAEHLISKGFRNFVNIGYKASWSAKVTHKGFKSISDMHGCPIKRYLYNNKATSNLNSWKKLTKDFAKWVKTWQPPLGIFCSLSSIGPLVTGRCNEYGLKVPKDAAVISCGNEIAYCEGFRPSITSIEINYHEIGFEAARLLDLKMQGKPVGKKITLIPPVGCIPRESTDNYVVEDADLKKALRYISDNYTSNIQVVDVLDAANVSRSTLERRFKDTIGHSIFDEINRMKIASAKRHLVETDKEVKQIAELCGFGSSNHLIRVFREHTGETPGRYREKIKIPEL